MKTTRMFSAGYPVFIIFLFFVLLLTMSCASGLFPASEKRQPGFLFNEPNYNYALTISSKVESPYTVEYKKKIYKRIKRSVRVNYYPVKNLSDKSR